MESITATTMAFGILLLLVSWVQLLIVSFKEDFTWGLGTLFLPPVSYLYSLFALDKAGSSVMLAILGWILIFIAL